MMAGKKTYILGTVLALATFAHSLGWIDDSLYQLIAGLAGGGGLMTLRAGIKRDTGG